MLYDVMKAMDIAFEAHHGQYRKYTGEPYITHPLFVFGVLKDLQCSSLIQCGALLHDVLEDTNITYEFICDSFDPRLADILVDLDDSVYTGNREQRHASMIESWRPKDGSVKSYEAKIIRLADITHNIESISVYEKSFACIYLREKMDLMPYLSCSSALYMRCLNRLKYLINMLSHDHNRKESKIG